MNLRDHMLDLSYRLSREILEIREGLRDLHIALSACPPADLDTSVLGYLFNRDQWKATKQTNHENRQRFASWRQRVRGRAAIGRIVGYGGSLVLLWLGISHRSVGVCLLAVLWYGLMLMGLSRIMRNCPKPSTMQCSLVVRRGNAQVFGGTGFVAGAAAGAYLAAGIGVAGGPLGAIAGTVPGAIIGGILGWLGGEQVCHQLEKQDQPAIESARSPKAGAVAGFLAGAAGGAALGSGLGLAAGPLGAVAGTIPGAIIGGLIGMLSGARLAR